LVDPGPERERAVKRVTVTRFMRPEPPVATPDMSLAEFVSGLESNRVRSMVVVDDEGRVVGIVSESDLFLKERGVPFSKEKVPTLLGRVIGKEKIDQPDHSTGITVGDIMTRDVVSVSLNDTLEDIAWLMLRKRVSLVPVVVDDKLAGEVRRVDVLRIIYGDDLRPELR
jgi:CBS domain-containing protein